MFPSSSPAQFPQQAPQQPYAPAPQQMAAAAGMAPGQYAAPAVMPGQYAAPAAAPMHYAPTAAPQQYAAPQQQQWGQQPQQGYAPAPQQGYAPAPQQQWGQQPQAAPQPNGLFRGVEQAQVNYSGEYLKPGQYWARIDETKIGVNQKRENNLIIGMTIIHVIDNAGGMGHTLGAKSSKAVPQSSRYFLSEAKKFIAGVLGVKAEDVNEQTCNEVFGPKAPLVGMVVEFRAFNKMTQKNQPFTQVSWLREVKPQEIKATLPAPVVQYFFPHDALDKAIAAEQANGLPSMTAPAATATPQPMAAPAAPGFGAAPVQQAAPPWQHAAPAQAPAQAQWAPSPAAGAPAAAAPTWAPQQAPAPAPAPAGAPVMQSWQPQAAPQPGYPPQPPAGAPSLGYGQAPAQFRQ